ncbi:MAG: signal recognition particle-docking protein FtsY, partial [Rhodobacteraceae bacterium]|nr:signal recognition particle-docking protein FtsY [Paracoccaceae bacterium]
ATGHTMSNVADEPPQGKPGWFSRLRQGLTKTREGLSSRLGQVFSVGKALDQSLIDEIETLLITSDFGMTVTQEVIHSLTRSMSRKTLKDAEAVREALKTSLVDMIAPSALPLTSPEQGLMVVLMVGVNGAGKTTTAGKLAHFYKAQGRQVMLAAGDTYRAAAVEQLKTWGTRNHVDVVAQQTGADSASVIFDAVTSAKAKGADVLIVDTAGRLQAKTELMDELAKICRVIGKKDDAAPHDRVIVLDGTVGQNALSQVSAFKETAGLTGMIVTKLDGSARGGVVVALAQEFGLPIHAVGVGEGKDDLDAFDAVDFGRALAGLDAQSRG